MAIEIIKRNISKINREVDLIHQVTLGSTSKSKTRLSEFFTSKFKTTKYKDHSELEHLTVSGSDFFVIKGRTSFIDTDGKERFKEELAFISYPHLLQVKKFLEEAKDWLESEDYADMFVQWEGATILNDKYMNLNSVVRVALDKPMTAYPTVLSDCDIYYEAVGLNIDNKIDVYFTYDELCSLLHLISTINLYEASLQLITLKNVFSSSGSTNKQVEKYMRNKQAISNISRGRTRVNTVTDEDIDINI